MSASAVSLFQEIHPAEGQARARCVVIHGLGEHSGRHLATIRALNHGGVEVVRFDWRGCGRSPGEPQWIEKFSEYVDDALGVVQGAEARGKLPLFLHGHSAGGVIAVHTAAELGGRLRGLSLSAPAFEIGAGVSKLKILAGRVLARVTPHLRIPGALDLSALSRDPAVAPAYTADPLCVSFNTVRQGNELLGALERMPGLCARISVPTLIQHGDADRLVPVTGSPRLHAAFATKDKTLKIYPGGFHELHNDLPKDEYFRTLVDWIGARV